MNKYERILRATGLDPAVLSVGQLSQVTNALAAARSEGYTAGWVARDREPEEYRP